MMQHLHCHCTFSSTNPSKLSAPPEMTIALPSPPFSSSTPPIPLLVLGRSAKKLPSNSMQCKAVVIDDAQVSSIQCAVLFYSGRVYVADVGSANGTRVKHGVDGFELVLKHSKVLDAQSATTENDVALMAKALVPKAVLCHRSVTIVKIGEFITLTLHLPEQFTSDENSNDTIDQTSIMMLSSSSKSSSKMSSSNHILDSSVVVAPVKSKAVIGSKKRPSSSEPLGGRGVEEEERGGGGGGRGKKKVMKQTTLILPFQPPQFIGRPPRWGLDGEHDNTEATRALGAGYAQSFRPKYDDEGINSTAFLPTSDEEAEEAESNRHNLIRNFFRIRPGLREDPLPLAPPLPFSSSSSFASSSSTSNTHPPRNTATEAVKAAIAGKGADDHLAGDNGDDDEPEINFEDFIRLSTSQEVVQQEKEENMEKVRPKETICSSIREDHSHEGGGGGGSKCRTCNVPTEIIAAWNQFSADMLKKRSNLSSEAMASMFLKRREANQAPINLVAPSKPLGIEGAKLSSQPTLTEEATESYITTQWLQPPPPPPPPQAPHEFIQEESVTSTPLRPLYSTQAPPLPHLSSSSSPIDLLSQSPEHIKQVNQQEQLEKSISPKNSCSTTHALLQKEDNVDEDEDKEMNDDALEPTSSEIDSLRFLIHSDRALRMQALSLSPLSIDTLQAICKARDLVLSSGTIKKVCKILNVASKL
jgi:hypothetical protein